MDQTTFETSLRTARVLLSLKFNLEKVLTNELIPVDHREEIRKILERESTIVLRPAKVIVDNRERENWLYGVDRTNWYYWPALKDYLIINKGWDLNIVNSLDDVSDRLLSELRNPTDENFNIRGLVIGYVQSGKTANYTALIAKAADAGYRLVIVLSGIDNGLRRQTQIRLDNELVGFADNRTNSVPLPPIGRQWQQLTTEDINGDFQPGFVSPTMLQTNQPTLLVIKKNGTIIRKLIHWLDRAHSDVIKSIPVLVIDDEADQASIDTRGDYFAENEPIPKEYEKPSVINRLIRNLLNKFEKKVYVAYTATPFANILIPHDATNPEYEIDLYPKDFIIDLPKPEKYFGAEDLFGRFDAASETEIQGLDIIREIPESDFLDLRDNLFPQSLQNSLYDFILSGACRAYRGDGNKPCTMLLHGSHLVTTQSDLRSLFDVKFSEMKNQWRYAKYDGLYQKLFKYWNEEFRPIIRQIGKNDDVGFDRVVPHIENFMQQVQVKVINSQIGDVLDYIQEPSLKAIAIGGNKLSRGLTLEGLLVSYFFRTSPTYDTLMQMGRWFGYRDGYEDISRIYMTNQMSGWFHDLARVEYELREDIQIYEAENITPKQMSVKILKHSSMNVTSRLKRRFANELKIEQSYSNQVLQTIYFPFDNSDELSKMSKNNISVITDLVTKLPEPSWENTSALWNTVQSGLILKFIEDYIISSEDRVFIKPLVMKYITDLNQKDELSEWTICIKGRETIDQVLGEIDLGLKNKIPFFSRSRKIIPPNSLGVITSPGDETIGFSEEMRKSLDDIQQKYKIKGINPASRLVRSPKNGLIIIYPISKFSGYNLDSSTNKRMLRRKLFEDPNDIKSENIMGMALSFPKSEKSISISKDYLIGTAGWQII